MVVSNHTVEAFIHSLREKKKEVVVGTARELVGRIRECRVAGG